MLKRPRTGLSMNGTLNRHNSRPRGTRNFFTNSFSCITYSHSSLQSRPNSFMQMCVSQNASFSQALAGVLLRNRPRILAAAKIPAWVPDLKRIRRSITMRRTPLRGCCRVAYRRSSLGHAVACRFFASRLGYRFGIHSVARCAPQLLPIPRPTCLPSHFVTLFAPIKATTQ